ncbi:helix-turn-helix transcriptional regulator [Caulobacter sp. AP07]|uniref:helix-turn-helix transcriptional regulator n=1 Tax=Caulobacter sp. AP07 TaxID=1144304 RepID=UPI0012F7B86E|nr:helix-turn-helix transcriptional regulator [Caulobacter sp. AP07]
MRIHGTSELDRLGDLTASIGSENFAMTYYDVFRDLLNIEECTVFSFQRSNKPKPLIAEGRNERPYSTRQLAQDYVSGGYLEDPNVISRHVSSNGAYVIQSEEIKNELFRRHYYEFPAIAQEMVMKGDAGGTLYYASFYRKADARQFDLQEMQTINALSGFITKALHRHSELFSPCNGDGFSLATHGATSAEVRDRTLEHLSNVLFNGPHRLSKREAEICAGIVLGYSTLAISLNCAISPNTVATHRKRAYAKMGISSQNELFTRYFSSVREFQSRLAH